MLVSIRSLGPSPSTHICQVEGLQSNKNRHQTVLERILEKFRSRLAECEIQTLSSLTNEQILVSQTIEELLLSPEIDLEGLVRSMNPRFSSSLLLKSKVQPRFMSGVPIYFPRLAAFEAQTKTMLLVIRSALNGEHCVIESPTGTGKTIALLCATLGWQRHTWLKMAEEDAVARVRNYQQLFGTLPSQSQTQMTDDSISGPTQITNNDDNEEPENEQELSSYRTIHHEDPFSFRGSLRDMQDSSGNHHSSPGTWKPLAPEVCLPDASDVTCSGESQTLQAETPDGGDDEAQRATRKAKKLNATMRVQPPTIFYATRTHAQLKNVVAELRQTPHRVRMASLAARVWLCPASEGLLSRKNVDDFCEERRAAMDLMGTNCAEGCDYLRNMTTMEGARRAANCLVSPVTCQTNPAADGLWDIEDCNRYCSQERVTRGLNNVPMDDLPICPYYASKTLSNLANLIFLPYPYLLSPLVGIASKMKDKLAEGIVVFDEAHNIEDVCREEASFEFDENLISGVKETLMVWAAPDSLQFEREYPGLEYWSDPCISELSRVAEAFLSDMSGFFKFVEVQSDMARQKPQDQIVKQDRHEILSFGAGGSNGEVTHLLKIFGLPDGKLLDVFYQLEAALRPFMFVVKRHFMQSHKKMRGQIAQINRQLLNLEKLSIYIDLLIKNHQHYSVRVAYEKEERKASYQIVLKLWCLWPGVLFEPLAKTTRTIVLASGTVSPMESLLSELGPSFRGRCPSRHVQSLPHVIEQHQFQLFLMQDLPLEIEEDVQSSSIVALRDSCIGDRIKVATSPVRANYHTLTKKDYYRRLGLALLLCLSTIPGGVVLFLTNYAVLQRAVTYWKQSIWRGDTTWWQAFETLKSTVCVESSDSAKFAESFAAYKRAIKERSRAFFIGVYRGKLAEGTSLNDDLARGVLCVGIPFASNTDLKIICKQRYNDGNVAATEDPAAEGLISGREWYRVHAYRALFQAVGRVLRHSKDYGVALLLDERHFQDCREKGLSRMNFPRWTTTHVSRCSTFQDLLPHLETFFARNRIEKRNRSTSGQRHGNFMIMEGPKYQHMRRRTTTYSTEPATEESLVRKKGLRSFWTKDKRACSPPSSPPSPPLTPVPNGRSDWFLPLPYSRSPEGSLVSGETDTPMDDTTLENAQTSIGKRLLKKSLRITKGVVQRKPSPNGTRPGLISITENPMPRAGLISEIEHRSSPQALLQQIDLHSKEPQSSTHTQFKTLRRSRRYTTDDVEEQCASRSRLLPFHFSHSKFGGPSLLPPSDAADCDLFSSRSHQVEMTIVEEPYKQKSFSSAVS